METACTIHSVIWIEAYRQTNNTTQYCHCQEPRVHVTEEEKKHRKKWANFFFYARTYMIQFASFMLYIKYSLIVWSHFSSIKKNMSFRWSMEFQIICCWTFSFCKSASNDSFFLTHYPQSLPINLITTYQVVVFFRYTHYILV